MEIDAVAKGLDRARKIKKDGTEYWMGRDIQEILGYTKWDNFENVIGKASMACESTGAAPTDHLLEVKKMITAGKGARVEMKDFFLSRYGCYLIAMNGDPSKPEIATAQTYFAIQTRRQELQDQLTDEQKRVLLRERVRTANTCLNGAAKQSGVVQYGLFHDAGYRGLYGFGVGNLKLKKGIALSEDFLDCTGREELAANEFRITQTESRLRRQQVNGQKAAEETHHAVGKEVRNAIAKIGGTMPENLPREENIKQLPSWKMRKSLTSRESVR